MRYDANLIMGDRVLFGDFVAGNAVVHNVHSGDESGAGISTCLAPGDWLRFATAGPPLAGHDILQPYLSDTRVIEVDEATRMARLDPRRSQRLVICSHHCCSPDVKGGSFARTFHSLEKAKDDDVTAQLTDTLTITVEHVSEL